MTGKSVRVPDDLHARMAARTDTHGPITAQVTRALTRALDEGDDDGSAQEVLVVEVPVPQATARAARVGVVNPRGQTTRVTRTRVTPAACLHPVGRRIGTGCGACGLDPVVGRR